MFDILRYLGIIVITYIAAELIAHKENSLISIPFVVIGKVYTYALTGAAHGTVSSVFLLGYTGIIILYFGLVTGLGLIFMCCVLLRIRNRLAGPVETNP